MTTQEFNLAADFPDPTQQEWEQEVLRVLNRRRPEGRELTAEQAYERLTSHTVDGLTIKPLYVREDAPGEIGHPGVAPFTRGTTVRNGDMAGAWHISQLHEDPDAAFTNNEVLADLERGGSAAFLRVDPDALATTDLARALEGVLLDLAPVLVTSRTKPLDAARALADVFATADASKVSGSMGVDPVGAAALAGTAPDLGQLQEAVEIAKPYPRVRPIVVDSTVFHNAGAGDVHELAYAIAIGVEYVRQLVADGHSPDDAFGQIVFRVSATTEQFLTIARLRALRTLWNRVGEVLGVAEENRGAHQHAVTSLRQLTRDDAYVNILRATIASFAAAAGGAEYQSVLPFDTVLGLPSTFSRRIARNVQVLLAEESNVGRVNDPAGGSWYVESMTTQMAEEAWKVFQALDADGFVANLTNGTVAAQLAELNTARAERLAKRKLPITGVSTFPNHDEPRTPAKPRPAAPEFSGLTPVRDSEVFEALRDRAEAARADGRPPAVALACIGTRRDFGAREGFTSNLFHVAGIDTPILEGTSASEISMKFLDSGAKIVVLCSSPKQYAAQGLAVAGALREAGAKRILLAGQLKELGVEAPSTIDGTVFDGMDVVKLLDSTLDQLGAQQ